MASNGYVKMLSTYEIFRLKNATTDEDKQMLASLEAYATELRQGRELVRRSAADFAAFF